GREEARIWNVATGQTILRIHDKNGMDYLTGLAFSPDGRQLAASNRGVFFLPSVTVWDLASAAGQQSLYGLSGQIEVIAISNDGRRLAALAHNWEIGLWDLDSGRLCAIFEAPPGMFADSAALSFSPDGRRLAYSVAAQHAEEARLWSTDSCQEIKRWKLPPGLQNKIVFGDAGQLWHFQVEIQSGLALPDSAVSWKDHPRVCRVRDLNAGPGLKVTAEIPDFNRHVFQAVAPQQGRHVVVEGLGTEPKVGRWVKVIDLPTGKVIWSRDIERQSKSARLIVEPSGKAFYYTPTEELPALRASMPDGKPAGTVPIMPDAVSDGGGIFGTVHETAKLSCYERQDGIARSAVRFSPNTDIVAVTFARNQARIAWGGRDGSLVVCDLPGVRAKLSELSLGW
ncbi:MAG TPA: WD40 repeat domain-containing protein, partial [Gemmataceae bacterium]|nr:WD40 repeat domain-containing protein [Gemmataceae bacterium]